MKEIKVSNRLKDLLFDILSSSPKLVISPIRDRNESPSSLHGIWEWDVGYDSLEDLESIIHEKSELDSICKVLWNNVCNDSIADGIYISEIIVSVREGVLTLEQHRRDEYPSDYKEDVFPTNHISAIIKESLFENMDSELKMNLKALVEFEVQSIGTKVVWLEENIRCGIYTVSINEIPDEVMRKIISNCIFSRRTVKRLLPDYLKRENGESHTLKSYEFTFYNESYSYAFTTVTSFRLL